MEHINAVTLIQSVKGDNAWFGATLNCNIYKGCDHGCIYCDSRSNCYQIKEFDRVRVKKDAPLKIEEELRKKRKKGVVSLGGMNDPYNRFEKELEYTKQALESINKHQFGVFVITKSDLVLRDIEVFKKIKKHSMCNIGITITTASDRLQKRIERNVSSTSDRFKALKKLREEGIFAGILMMPILPFINDTIENITSLVMQAKEANVNYIYPSFGVTLRENQRDHFFGKIGPELTKKYIETFQDSYMCVSVNHKELRKHFVTLCEKYGILYKMNDIVKMSFEQIETKQIALDL